MFILLNGSFGIGKTTAAHLLAKHLPGTAIFDPERVGYVLRRLPAFMLGLRQQPADYQDLAAWRWLIIGQARWAHWRFGTVIVPMTFTDPGYLDAFSAALERTAPVRRLCLVAPLEVVRLRLAKRARAEGRNGLTAFETRRSAGCVAAHVDPAFGAPVDATASSEVVITRIMALIESQPARQ